MQFSNFRGAVAAAMMFVGLCGAAPSAARAEAPVVHAAVPAGVMVTASTPIVAAATPAMSGSAWIAQGTVTVPATPNMAAPTGAIPLSMVPRAASLMELVSDMPVAPEMTDDMKCLAQAVYFESRGEPVEGQLAVAQVVLNRASSGRYPADLCDVITQKAQFSFIHRGRFPTANRSSEAWRRSVAVAKIARDKLARSIPSDVLWYHATYVSPSWGKRLNKSGQIGLHIFYS